MGQHLLRYEAQTRQALAEHFKSNPPFKASKRGPHTEMHPMSKGQVMIGGPLEMKLIRVDKDCLVSIPRSIEK